MASYVEYVEGDFDGKDYKIKLDPGLENADRDTKSYFAELVIKSTGGKGIPIEDGVILITEFPQTTHSFEEENGAFSKVRVPASMDPNSNEGIALAELLAPGQYAAAQNTLAQQQAAKDMGAFEAFGRSALGEGKQLATGLQQQWNRLTNDPTRFAELQAESDKRQQNLDAISGESPWSSFLGSTVPYFAPLGLGPAARAGGAVARATGAAGLASRVAQPATNAVSKVASKVPQVVQKAAKGVKGLGELASTPIAAAPLIGAAEGTVHPQQRAWSGALLGSAGNTLGRHISKWTPLERSSKGEPVPEFVEIDKFLRENGGYVPPFVARPGDRSVKGDVFKDITDPSRVDEYFSVIEPTNEKALFGGILNDVVEGLDIDNAKVKPIKNAIAKNKITREVFTPLRGDITKEVKKNKDAVLSARGRESTTQGWFSSAEKETLRAENLFNDTKNRLDVLDALTRSTTGGKIDSEKVYKNLDFRAKRKKGVLGGIKDRDRQRLNALVGKVKPARDTAGLLVDLGKQFDPSTMLGPKKVKGGLNDFLIKSERFGLGKYRLPENTIGNIGTAAGASSSSGDFGLLDFLYDKYDRAEGYVANKAGKQ